MIEQSHPMRLYEGQEFVIDRRSITRRGFVRDVVGAERFAHKRPRVPIALNRRQRVPRQGTTVNVAVRTAEDSPFTASSLTVASHHRATAARNARLHLA